MVTFNANFRKKGASATNDFWHQKSRVPGLSYGEIKLPKSSTAWVGCTNVTDRQTDRRQTTDGIAAAISERNVVTFVKNYTCKNRNAWQSPACIACPAQIRPQNSGSYWTKVHQIFVRRRGVIVDVNSCIRCGMPTCCLNFRRLAPNIGYHSNVPWAITKRRSDSSWPHIYVPILKIRWRSVQYFLT